MPGHAPPCDKRYQKLSFEHREHPRIFYEKTSPYRKEDGVKCSRGLYHAIIKSLYRISEQNVNCGDYVFLKKNSNLRRLICCVMVFPGNFLSRTEKNLLFTKNPKNLHSL
jgi:hypothetical protein